MSKWLGSSTDEILRSAESTAEPERERPSADLRGETATKRESLEERHEIEQQRPSVEEEAGDEDAPVGEQPYNIPGDAVIDPEGAAPATDTAFMDGGSTPVDPIPTDMAGDDEYPSGSSPNLDVASGGRSSILTKLDAVDQNVHELAATVATVAGEVQEMRKLYHNEFAARLVSMQNEIERYREIEKGRIYDTILGEVAKLYSTYEEDVDKINDEKLKKSFRYLFDDIVQILEANNVQIQKSEQGEKRNTRHCQVIERIPTTDPELHDAVARSWGAGFYIDTRTLVKERVDVYLYSEADASSAQS